MRLKNKKTGEIGNLVLNINPNRESYSVLSTENGDTICGNLVLADYDSLAELNEEWEDAPEEEPKEHWIINAISGIETTDRDETDEPGRAMIEIGNYFDTREEAEKAVEKLKAWKRLRDKGFKFHSYYDNVADIGKIYAEFPKDDPYGNVHDDLDLLFGGEE